MRLLKDEATERARGIACAEADWMTEDFVTLSATLTFSDSM